MKEKLYTIGEIFRLGLLKNHKGQPYKDKATVSREINKAKFQIQQTAWGPAKVISKAEIDRVNKSRKL